MPDLSALEDSHPVNVGVPIQKTRAKRWPWILLGIIFILLFIAGGAYFGYQEGIRERLARQSSEITTEAATQFDLGVVDLQAGNLVNAQERFIYVLNLDPSFPGLMEQLTAVQLAMNLTQTPVAVDTPTPTEAATTTPTPDTRGQAELFAQIQQNISDKKWSDAITNLDALRKLDLTYKAVQADDMYYIALRNLGDDQISLYGQLEQGLYNLALAERFGPLDNEAAGLQIYARLYLDGASFWLVDWGYVVSAFKQIYLVVPSLRDGSGMTATERFRVASIKYGDQLMEAKNYCKAQEQYDAALPLSGGDATLSSSAASAKQECERSSQTPVPPATSTSPPVATATETLTPPPADPIATQSPTPTETPTFTQAAP